MTPQDDGVQARLDGLEPVEPSAADEARVRARLEQALGVVLPVATVGVAVGATSAAAASTATSGGVSAGVASAGAAAASSAVSGVTLALIAAGSIVVGSVGGVVWLRANPTPEAPATPPSAPVLVVKPSEAPVERPLEVMAVAPPPAEVPAAVPATTPPAPSALRVPPPPRRDPTASEPPVAAQEPAAPPVADVAPPEPEPTAPPSPPQEAERLDPELTCDAEAEGRFAQAGLEHLEAGRAAHALALLDTFGRRCPSGRWSERTWVVRVGSLCVLGKAADARGLKAWHADEYPERVGALDAQTQRWCAAR